MKVAIFGSCVSRDALAMCPIEGIEVAEYIARSSLASAFRSHPAPERWLQRLPRIESAFQRRMVDIDLQKRAADILSSSQADVVMVDMIDERFRVAKRGNGCATWSNEFALLELRRDEFDEVLDPTNHEREVAWKAGMQVLIQSVMPRRLVINRAFWSRQYTNGNELPGQRDIRIANEYLKAMYDNLETTGREMGANVSVIRYPDVCLCADAQHKWGPSPFHFTQAFYEHTMHELAQIRKLLNC